MLTHPIEGMALHEDPDVHIAKVALGVTIYLAEPLFWGAEGAGKALEVFLQRCPAERLGWYTSSLRDDWVPIRSTEHRALVERA